MGGNDAHFAFKQPLIFEVVHCGNAEGLQTIVLYGACGASSTPCGGVHHILSPLAIIVVHYGNVTESFQTTGTLALRYIVVQIVHAVAECITHSRKRQNSILLPYDPPNPQKPMANI